MFLLIEPPTSAIRRAHSDTVAVYRRSGLNSYTPQWSRAVASSDESLGDFVALCMDTGSTPHTVEAFERVIDIEQLFAWTCINALLGNDDTTDELYLFERRPKVKRSQPGRLSVMAWDYDDLLRSWSRADDPLLHSTTAALEQTIKRSPELYERMRRSYARLLTHELSVERVLATLRDVHRLRDSLDDGRPAAVQSAHRAPRAARVAEYELLISERHARLLEAATTASPR
jgi:hypothetical protein